MGDGWGKTFRARIMVNHLHKRDGTVFSARENNWMFVGKLEGSHGRLVNLQFETHFVVGVHNYTHRTWKSLLGPTSKESFFAMQHSNLRVLHVWVEFEASFTVDDLLNWPIWATNVSNYFRGLILLLTFFFHYDHSLEKRIFISEGPNGIFLANCGFNFPKYDLFVWACAYKAWVVFKPRNLLYFGLMPFEGLTNWAFPKFD